MKLGYKVSKATEDILSKVRNNPNLFSTSKKSIEDLTKEEYEEQWIDRAKKKIKVEKQLIKLTSSYKKLCPHYEETMHEADLKKHKMYLWHYKNVLSQMLLDRKKRINVLLIARFKEENSLFHHDYMPLDIFKYILKLSRFNIE